MTSNDTPMAAAGRSVAADPRQLQAGGHPGELRAGGADVGHYRCRQRQDGGSNAEALADQPGQSLAGGDAHTHTELVEDHQRGRGEHDDPEQLVPVVGAEDRVGRDAGRVVVGEPGQHAGAHDSGEGDQPATPAHVVSPT